MTSDIERRAAKSLLASKSLSGSAGKAMVVGGASTLALTFLAGLIPFVGPVLAAIVVIGLGLALWE